MTLDAYLRAYVRRRRRAAVARAAGWATATAVGLMLLACGVDRLVPLPPSVRVAWLLMVFAVALTVVARPVGRWLRRRFDPVAAAAAIERAEPAFAHQLVTAASPGGSAALRAAVDQAAIVACVAVGPPPVPRRPAAVAGTAAVLSLAVVAGLWRWPWLDMPDLSRRLVRPLSDLPAVTATRLRLRPGPASVVEGRPWAVTVDRVVGSGGVALHVSDDGGQTWTVHRMTAAGSAFTATVPAVDQDLRCYATSGDAATPTVAVRVRRVPAVTGVRVRYEFPPADGRLPLTVPDAAGQIVAPPGTVATVDVTATVPLRSATLSVNGTAVPTTATPDRRVRRGRFTVTTDGSLDVRLTADDGTVGRGPPLRVRIANGDDVAGFEEQLRAYRAATRASLR